MTRPEASLPQRLGYAPDARLMIINCDDIGSSHAANLASLEAMQRGVATSATLMVPCPWAREAVELFAGQDVGVHLVLTAEYPTYRWRSLTGAKSLHDNQGYLPWTVAEARERARVEDVAAECRAQIEQAYAWGVDVTHLDSHMGTVQLDPRFFEVYLALAEEFRLPVRMVSARAEPVLGFESRAPAAGRGILFADEVWAQWGRPTGEQMRTVMPRLKPGTVAEFLVHPVFDGPELRGYDLTEARIRVDDHAVAVDPEIRALIEAESLIPISYRPLRELQRAGALEAA